MHDEDAIKMVGSYIDKIADLPWPHNATKDEYFRFFDNLPRPQKAIWSTWILQLEVDNGGFEQFFYNLWDDLLLSYCMEGLAEISAHKILYLLRKAINLVEDCRTELDSTTKYEDWLNILKCHGVENKLYQLDNKFYQCKKEYYELRKRYIRDNIESFAMLEGDSSQTP